MNFLKELDSILGSSLSPNSPIKIPDEDIALIKKTIQLNERGNTFLNSHHLIRAAAARIFSKENFPEGYQCSKCGGYFPREDLLYSVKEYDSDSGTFNESEKVCSLCLDPHYTNSFKMVQCSFCGDIIKREILTNTIPLSLEEYI